MSNTFLLCVLTALLVGAPTSGLAQQAAKPAAKSAAKKSVEMKEQTPGLLARAKFPADSARKLAQAKMPGGTITKEEVRQDNGKLVYSFYFKSASKPGRDAVDVDATTGSVANPRHETATAAKTERKGATTKSPPAKP